MYNIFISHIWFWIAFHRGIYYFLLTRKDLRFFDTFIFIMKKVNKQESSSFDLLSPWTGIFRIDLCLFIKLIGEFNLKIVVRQKKSTHGYDPRFIFCNLVIWFFEFLYIYDNLLFTNISKSIWNYITPKSPKCL